MKLLLIGDEYKSRRMYSWGFATEQYRVTMASSRTAVVEALTDKAFHAACLDFRMRDDSPEAILETLQARAAGLPVVALLGAGDRRVTTTMHERRVAAQLVSPFPIDTLHATLRAHALTEAVGGGDARESSAPVLTPAVVPMPVVRPLSPPKMMNHDEAARRLVELALRAGNSHAAILILGETGTGKTQLAQLMHQNSPLRQKPFVTVNCPCLNHELLESDLFGHVRGAFTGAVQDTWGKVAAAEGGTLFLDEIGDLPMSLQPKLLRLLQEKQYERVGETVSRSAHVRIVAATNRDLKREVAAGRFREDLFYRLNVIAIEAPPLRGRAAQILGAAETFLQGICQQLGKTPPRFSVAARRLLEAHAWPGNLRELRNVVERAAILSTGSVLEPDDFPTLQAQPGHSRLQVGAAVSLHALETAHIQMVVASSSSLEEAARILEIDKSTLYRKRKQMEAQLGRPTATVTATPFEVAAAG